MMNNLNNTIKSLNDMPLHERMEYQRVHDRAIISQAFMQGTTIELKTFAGKRTHPFALENIRRD